MGTARKVGSGRWELRFYDGTKTASGRPRQRSVTIEAKDRRSALAEAIRLEGLARDAPRSERTVGDALKAWVESGGRRTSARAQAEVARRVRDFTLPVLGEMPLRELTVEHLERLYADLARRKSRHTGRVLSAQTVRHVHWDLSGALDLAVRWGWLAYNPAQRVRLAPMRRQKPSGAPPGDVEAMLCHLDGLEGWAPAETALAMRLALATGARQGEVCGLRWSDFVDGAVNIVRAAIRPIPRSGGEVIVRSTKTGSVRRLTLPGSVASAVEVHHAALLAVFGRVPSNGYLLLGRAPFLTPLDPGTLESRFARYRGEVGVKFRFHDLRHSAVTAWLESGITVNEAAGFAGHARASTTSDLYGHVAMRLDERTADAVNARYQLGRGEDPSP